MKKFLLIFSLTGMAAHSQLFQNSKLWKSLEQDCWKAPGWADTLINPYPVEPLTLPQGEELCDLYCRNCHKENEPNNKIGPDPGDDTAGFFKSLQNQTKGAIYWKITTGRSGMPAFEEVLPEEQRWQLAEYLKQLAVKY